MSIYTKDLPYTPYFYIIQHASGMLYAGCRYSKVKTNYSINGCHPSELLQNDGYLTSSKLVKKLIKSDGLQSFSIKIILEESILEESVLTYETKFLQENDISSNPAWLNMHNNDSNWFNLDYVKSIMLERYGVENAFSAIEIIEKIKLTSLERYGVEYPMQNKEICERMKTTMLERYGVEYPIQNKEIKEKIDATMLERYGALNAFASKQIIEKIHNINLERYGVKHPLQNKDIFEKYKQTCLDTYGVDNPAKNIDVQLKMKNTSIERYGVDNYGKTKEAKAALSKRSKGAKFYNDGYKNYFVPPDQTPDPNWLTGMKPRNKIN